jgi:hypothetical protein
MSEDYVTVDFVKIGQLGNVEEHKSFKFWQAILRELLKDLQDKQDRNEFDRFLLEEYRIKVFREDDAPFGITRLTMSEDDLLLTQIKFSSLITTRLLD